MMHRLAIVVLILAATGLTNGQEPPGKTRTWTLDEALSQLAQHPNDPYLQFVALQLARRDHPARLAEVHQQVERLMVRDARQQARDRAERVDLFSLFSGALAVQESLQLDAMRPRNENHKQPPNTVAIADLKGPTIKSHPWKQMLGDRKPDISPLARCVPEDNFFIEFRSLTKMLEVMDLSDLWSTHVFNQAYQESRTQKVGERVKEQLAVETNPLLRPFYDLVVDEVAVTGSDLFLREGSDVTLIFRFKQPEVFKARMEGFLANAEKAHPDAKKETGRYAGVPFVHLATPDRTVSVFSAYPAQDLHVRSNSRVAFERVLAAIKGKADDGQEVRRLSDTDEFAYIRTILPRQAAEEDGLIYLSDPFIRRLMGPQVKLTERRRMVCYNHLRMIGHAAQLYRTEHGKPPASLAELATTGCCPGPFNEGELKCPEGGTYTLAADGLTGVCSHHGRALFLTPCCEIPVAAVSQAEADEYRRFLDEYNRYWRTFFDPIAIRIQVTPKQYRLETIVLPLIDNSIYTGLAATLGGAPEPLDALPVPRGNIFSVGMKLNKDGLLKNAMQAERDLKMEIGRTLDLPEKEADKLQMTELLARGVGNQVGFHVYDATPFFDFNLPQFMGMLFGSFNGSASGNVRMEELGVAFLIGSLNAPVYVSLPVQDGKIVDQFLDQLDKLLALKARQPERGGWFNLAYDFYKLPLAGETEKNGRAFSIRLGPVKWRIFWARIGDGLYIASKQFILDDLATLAKSKAEPRPDPGPVGHAMVRLRPKNWNQVLADYRLGWAESNRAACLNNLGPLTSVARAHTAGLGSIDEAELARVGDRIHWEADRLHGVHFFCPDGGRYGLAPDRKGLMCSVHGTALAPRQPAAPSGKSSLGQLLSTFKGLTATLTFLEDGLHAVVIIERE